VEATGTVPTGAWSHLVGVLAADGKIKIYVNGAPAATAVDAGLLAGEPGETMQVGCDSGSNGIGNYTTPYGFNGTIDQVRVYHKALSDADILAHFTDPASVPDTDPDQPLYFSFNAGTAADDSGNGNNGTILGAKVTTAGKIGKALDFFNVAGTGTFYWVREIPLHARAMAKAADAIFLAGPPDVDDQEYSFDHFDDRRVQARLRQQVLSFAGKLGGLMHVVSPATGDTLAEYRLSVPPVWDGMIAANGRIYMAMMDGTVVCYEPR
ncbi:MAG: LamG domain-containing protein, partial [Planctomycetes bacterium]|nr:LamG domain-containing protein [Planctomycetota bacterium]